NRESTYFSQPAPSSGYASPKGGCAMKISEVCSRDLVSVPAGAPLSEVARLMRERNVGAVVVTKAPADQPVVVGIITDRDIVCAQLERAADLSRLEAEQVMTRNPLVLNEDDSIENAIRH